MNFSILIYPTFLFYVGISILVLIYAEYIEPRWFKIKRVCVKSPKPLPRPITILHLSDIHFSGRPHAKDKFLEKLSDIKPDFIFITGDIIDCDEGINQAAHILGKLNARAGKFAILGNHDYWDYHLIHNFRYHLRGIKIADRSNDANLLVKKLEKVGIQVLNNRNMSVIISGQKIVIAGTDDPVTQTVDFEKTFAGVQNDSFNILLTHVVDVVVGMPKVDVDLVFSGHTHGGQFRVPILGGFMLGFKLPRKYLDGIHKIGRFTACVSRGIGASRSLVFRFFCRPEAILMEVVS